MVAVSSRELLWEFLGKVIFSLSDPKIDFSVFNSHINIAGGRLDILFHFPNDWDKNIEGKIEKIKIDFLPLPNTHYNGYFGHFSAYLVKAQNQF